MKYSFRSVQNDGNYETGSHRGSAVLLGLINAAGLNKRCYGLHDRVLKRLGNRNAQANHLIIYMLKYTVINRKTICCLKFVF